MGTTYIGLAANWIQSPRVRVIGRDAIDRVPADFDGFKLNEPHIATALILHMEIKPNQWKNRDDNNWLHVWATVATRPFMPTMPTRKPHTPSATSWMNKRLRSAPHREFIDSHKGKDTTMPSPISPVDFAEAQPVEGHRQRIRTTHKKDPTEWRIGLNLRSDALIAEQVVAEARWIGV